MLTGPKYLGLPIEFVRLDLAKGEQKQPEFLATNPNGKIPALEDGEVKLWESPAIMCYLACKAGSDLWPKDDLLKIDLIRWLNWDTAHFSRHAGTLFFERVIKVGFGLGEPNPTDIQNATGYFKQFAAVLNSHLRSRKYILGDRLTVADFALAGFLPYAQHAQLPIDDCDEIQRWHASLMELPAWRQPFPSN